MERYLVVDVVLAAALPLGMALLLGLLTRHKPDVYDFLGDGQLCLYAASLAFAALWDLGFTQNAPTLPWFSEKGWGYASLTAMMLVAVLVWVGSVDDRSREDIPEDLVEDLRKRGNRAATLSSLIVALITASIVGYFRYSWKLM